MISNGDSNNNEKGVEVRTHDIPVADAMSEFMKQGLSLIHISEPTRPY